MPAIKVAYNAETRKFVVSPHSTWAEFSSTLCAMFAIPLSNEITLSYTDEDGDEVTLSTDLELRDVLLNHVPEGGCLKFTLRTTGKTLGNENDREESIVILDNNGDGNSVSNSRGSSVCELSERDWVLEGISGHGIVINRERVEDDTSNCDGEFENIDEDKKSDNVESRPNEEAREDMHEHSGESSQAEVPNKEKDESRDNASPPTSDSQPTLDDLTQQLQSLVNQFQEFFNQNPQVIESANNLVHDVMDSVKGDIETFGEWLKNLKGQIEESIKSGVGTNEDRNVNRNGNTDESSQHAYTPLYNPSAPQWTRLGDSQACHRCPFLSGTPENTPPASDSQNSNNEKRFSDQAQDNAYGQHFQSPYWHAYPNRHHHHLHPHPHPHPHHTHPHPPHPPHLPANRPHLPHNPFASPPPQPQPPQPPTQEQEETSPKTVPYINELFRNLGNRLFSTSDMDELIPNDTMDYDRTFYARQTSDGNIVCGRGPRSGPRFSHIGQEGYPGNAESTGNVMNDNDTDNVVRNRDRPDHSDNEKLNMEHSITDDTATLPISNSVPTSNVQDFDLAPSDLLSDIRLLREMGFTQPTRELVNLFRRNDNHVDSVISILLEENEMVD